MDKKLQDLAWAVLPKGNKVYCRNIYRTSHDGNVIDLLERLYGLHNLTSDADGEDEMLYVSRKRVQEIYNSYCAERDKEEPGSNRSSLGGRIAMLQELFGSKCLLDEKEFAENANCKEPKSAEPKFKRGDMVIYKPTRKVKVVFGIDKYSRYCVALPNMQSPMYVDESDLEPYTEPKQPVSDCHHLQEPKPAEPKYHVGQMVRCLNDGEIYIVLAKVGKHHYSLQGVEHDVHEDYLEPYTEPEEENHIVENHEMVKDFDNILKDSFSKERRLNIAAIAMRGILNNPDEVYRAEICSTAKETPQAIAEYALALADALLAECEKGGKHD